MPSDAERNDAGGVVLHASHSHLFPGARLAAPGIDGPLAGGSRPRSREARIVFSDFSEADAELSRPDDAPSGHLLLDVAEYRTAPGRVISARAWLVEQQSTGGDGAAAGLRVVARADLP
ncbi:hypothetical protein [Zhihengliuella sp.]|uniref:hypothetical protein n=1 Tax=Zhihengliuella sp. TaxID=1954483 RepID=UPI002811EB23|nr:hypothetical protein [Zhihengliuella sp.]